MSTACPSQPPRRCTCMSASPGISTLPCRSVTAAPEGIFTWPAGPAASMVAPRMTTVACSTAGAPVPSMSTALVKACAGCAAGPPAPARAPAREVANTTTARMSRPSGTPQKRRSEGRRVPVSALGFRFRMRRLRDSSRRRLLEAHPGLDASGPRSTDHKPWMTGLFRTDEDGVTQVAALIGEILDEDRHLVALVVAPDPQIREAVSGAVARALHVVVRRVARPDVGVVDAREAGPAGGERPLIPEIARDREVGNLIDGAAGLLRSAWPLLGDVCIRVADAEAERQLGQEPPVEFELEARAARATRVARVTVPAQRQVNGLLDLVPIDGKGRAVEREAPVREARLEPGLVVPEVVGLEGGDAGCSDAEVGEILVAAGRRRARRQCDVVAALANALGRAGVEQHIREDLVFKQVLRREAAFTAPGCVIDALRAAEEKAVRHLVEGRRVAEPAHAYGGLEGRQRLVGDIAEQRVLLGVARIDETEQQIARRESRGRPGRGPLVVARPRAVGVEATDQQLHWPLEGRGKADFLREATQVLFARDRARYRRRRGGRRAEEELCHVGIILEL